MIKRLNNSIKIKILKKNIYELPYYIFDFLFIFLRKDGTLKQMMPFTTTSTYWATIPAVREASVHASARHIPAPCVPGEPVALVPLRVVFFFLRPP